MQNDDALFGGILRFIGLGPDDERALRELDDRLRSRLALTIDELCGVGIEHSAWTETGRTAEPQPELPSGPTEKLTREWLIGILDRPWTLDGIAERARIGQRFVLLHAAGHQLFLAASAIRQAWSEEVLEADGGPARIGPRLLAVNRLVDLELAAVFHGYGENKLMRARQTGRLATLGELAASIGHELRNPLGVIDSSVFLLRKRIGSEELNGHLDRIEGQVRISSRIIDDLLAIARDRPPIAESVELTALLVEAREAVTLAPGVKLTIDLPSILPPVRVDPSQMRQVLVNLLSNAADAVGDTGEIRIEAAEDDGRRLVLRVSDSGAGIDPAVRDQIFDPLVTTKARGIGLGLSLCKRLVERAGGTIAVEDGPLGGACFVVRLPQ